MSVLEQALRKRPLQRRDATMPIPDHIVRLRALILERLPQDLSKTCDVQPLVLCNNEEDAKALSENADRVMDIPELKSARPADFIEFAVILREDMRSRGAPASSVGIIQHQGNLMFLLAWGESDAAVAKKLAEHNINPPA